MMSNSPSPIDKQNLPRIAVIGAAFAVLGIVLFIVLWVMMGNAGVEQLPRLVVSVCLPPAIIAAILGVYILARPNR